MRGRCAGSAPLGRAIAAQLGIALLCLGVLLSDRLLDSFQAELQLFLRQALGFGAELHAL
jgi:hypothetical protein